MALDIVELLTQLFRSNGSDLHLACGAVPTARLVGELVPLNEQTVTDEQMLGLLKSIVTQAQYEEFLNRGELDFRWGIEQLALYRVNFYKTLRGVAAEFRAIPSVIPSMQSLGIAQHLTQLAMLDSGLVLVTGATGSGKSTAVASIVDYANAHRRDHILTIEDPIEFVYSNRSCFVSQREVGTHTPSFASALRMALREDPDIIVVGEMRDPETISLALEAAETGHLVFATLHTRSAAQTIDRIIDTFDAGRQQQIRTGLADSIQAILSVSLLRRADQKARVQAMEILLATPAIRNMIRDAKTFQIPSVLQTNRALGMRTMDDHLVELVKNGTVTKETALRYAVNRQRLVEQFSQR